MKTITVHGEILQETELAILVRCDDEADGVWLPKSRIKYSGECGDTDVEIEIPKMLADEKGFFDGMGGPEVETSPASVETPVKRVFGDNVKWIKEEKITVSQPLSEAEKARYADEMAALDGEIEALKDERAEVSNRLKKAIDAKEEERLALSRAVNEGEMREVLCDCLKDYNTEEMVWTEAWPPYAEVLRRKMTEEEKQPSLLEFQEKQDIQERQDTVMCVQKKEMEKPLSLLFWGVDGRTIRPINGRMRLHFLHTEKRIITIEAGGKIRKFH